MICEDQDEIVGALILFQKTNSYGEYVFDWAWADAFHRYGYRYYPKLLTAIPFTPATGPRMLLKTGTDRKHIVKALVNKVLQIQSEKEILSWHLLFPDIETERLISDDRFLERHGVQYHWINREFNDFGDHLSTFTSKRRKEAKRERKRVIEQGVHLELFEGSDLNEKHIDILFQCYQSTYAVRGQKGYLNREFFSLLSQRIPHAIALLIAFMKHQPVGMSFCLQNDEFLYGRYWGALYNIDCLHFEACFHSWIEYAIANKKKIFDPGAQGEHKLARGFQPVLTKSLHYISVPEFHNAISDFLTKERLQISQYLNSCSRHTPFNIDQSKFNLNISKYKTGQES